MSTNPHRDLELLHMRLNALADERFDVALARLGDTAAFGRTIDRAVLAKASLLEQLAAFAAAVIATTLDTIAAFLTALPDGFRR